MTTTSVKLEQVTKKFGDFTAVDSIDLSIKDGEFFSLLGPSGCGKTTSLRMIAGFEIPTEGHIYVMGNSVEHVPAHQRPVNTVFQSYALFPHMNVEKNVAFGLEMAKVDNAEITKRVAQSLELVQMSGFSKRKPNQLSGGQKQRVALARALVNRPKVLLLDEPLGALDLKLRKAMQLELKQIQSEVGITFVYVTHDQEEALTMSDYIAVMYEGKVMQTGRPEEIYEYPENRFVADFIGETNFLVGKVLEETACTHVDVNGVRVKGTNEKHTIQSNQQVTVAIRPEKIQLYAKDQRGQTPSENGENVIVPGKVIEKVYIGTDTRYLVALNEATQLFVREQNQGFGTEKNFNIGDELYVHWLAANAQILVE